MKTNLQKPAPFISINHLARLVLLLAGLFVSVNLASAQTFTFTDDPLTAQVTPVKAVHITQLRQAIDTLRSRNNVLPNSFPYTYPLTAGVTQIRGVHVTELRTALNAVYDTLGSVRPTYTDPTIIPGQTVIKRAHIEELRSAVRTADVFVLTVIIAGSGTGTVISSPVGIECPPHCHHAYPPGTLVTLTATPAAGSVFAGWSGGGCTGTVTTCTVTMNANTTVTATFSLQTFTLAVTRAGTGTGTVTSNPSGINCPTACSASFTSGTSVTLTATPSSGSTFSGWSGACTGTGTCTVLMNAPNSVTATFTASGTGILGSALNFGGPYPTPANVTYNNASSQSLTSLAFPGQIFLVVSPDTMSLSAATSLIQTNGGTVIAQIPAAGLYWVQVGVGTEASFINAVQGDPAVIYAGPNVPLTGSQANQPVDLSGATSTTPLIPSGANELIAQFDHFRFAPANDVCGLPHGFGVNGFLEQGGLGAGLYDVTLINRNTNQVVLFDNHALAAGSDLGFGMARAAEGALLQGQKLIVNMSLQAPGQPNDGQNRQICETNPFNAICFCDPSDTQCRGNYASWKTDQFAFLVGIAGQLHYMPDNLRNNTVVVISAGNSGLDLTNEIMLIREFLPRAFPHLPIVGSLGTNGQPFAGHNHSTSPTDMLYAPGVGVVVPGTGGCLANGTSFAGPAVANLAARLAQQFPALTSAQLVAAIQNAAPLVNGLRTIPTLAQAGVAAQNFSTGGCNPSTVIRIAGVVTNRNTGQSIRGATVQVVTNTNILSTVSSPDGSYSLCIPLSLRDQTSSIILQVFHSEFASGGIPINLNLGNQTVNVALDPLGTNIIIVETTLHHLGDSDFSTPLNAGLQLLTAEGISFSRSFTVTASQLPPNFTSASLLIAVNGAECGDPVTLNGTLIASLNNSAVGAQNFSIPFNISLLRNGSNTLTISSTLCQGFDDFEFSNVSIRLQ